MTHLIINHIRRYVAVPDEDVAGILSYFETVTLSKKQNLLEEGQHCNHSYFVVSGCLRLFFINEKGGEQTTQFALENWWMSDFLAFGGPRPAVFYIQAVEKTEALALSHTQHEKLLDNYPYLEKYFRLIYQKGYGASQQRIRYLYGLSREELYHQFAKQYPQFVQRVPQYLLASFLGFTPEYLSEIRNRR
ncbi:cyclic nucleotide-binding protein [Flavobacterium akiainvivens]|uniref:Cyclic nucleotide-binding protein n=1 Tax=Flavobacterium akiainvivens TaxID=1202724 RepID=A0A0M8MK91_9FLAO|nr:Crp/Fnr family transcriptional regulator [Flavobacterium akiainvivens]KOS07248.1 cyclic nucleotide-binding protein [Flavobacterium akiainvivens]SFQ45607.1 cAMP-binding domain of CRP or a regulatory subunit of cAMP-dependent protein kinases [Flavobacterium akiainvivens]